MKDIKILGVDIAKDVFQLCGIDEWGKVIYTRRVKRAQYVSTVASLKVGCVVNTGTIEDIFVPVFRFAHTGY